MNDKKLLLCGALYVFTAVDCCMHRNGLLDGAIASSGLFSVLGMLRCALMVLALWLASSVEGVLKTAKTKWPVRIVFFSSLAFVLFYGLVFILPVAVLFLLKLFAYVLTAIFLLWLKTQ